MCNKCVRRLTIAYDFKKQCQTSEQHLRSFISEVTTQFNKVTTGDSIEEDEEIASLLEAGYRPDEKAKTVKKEYEPFVPVSPKKSGIKRKIADSKESQQLPKPHLKQEIVEEHLNEEDTVNDDHIMQEDVLEIEYLIVDDELNITNENNDETESTVEYLKDNLNDYEDNVIAPSRDSESHYDDDDNISQEMLNEDTDSYFEHKIPRKKRSGKSESMIHICSQCNKDFSTKTNLLRHMKTHDGSKPYKCNICGNSFTQNGSLKQHMHIHTGMRPFVCNFCNRGFTQMKSLEFHKRRHTGEKPFTCQSCGLAFRQKDGLKVKF